MKTKLLTDFKTVLLEASKLFNRPPYQITLEQFGYVSKKRVSLSLGRVFGFAALRNATAPDPATPKSEIAEAKKIIQRLVASGA